MRFFRCLIPLPMNSFFTRVVVVVAFVGLYLLLVWLNLPWKECEQHMILVNPNEVKLIEYLSEISEDEEEPLVYLLEKVFLEEKEAATVHNCLTNYDKKKVHPNSSKPLEINDYIKRNLVGCFKTRMAIPTLRVMAEQHELLNGGHYVPSDRRTKEKVAVLVPYRKRKGQLRAFLHYMHPFLQRQKIEYQIFVIQQDNELPFNRGMLLNVGFVEAMKQRKFDCFIFHDIDLLPEDDRNLYDCPSRPSHLSVAIDKYCYKLPSHYLYGGVTAMKFQDFLKINGFSNSYWGWGGEDDDMFQRIVSQELSISRPSHEIGRYNMIKHNQQPKNENRLKLLMEARSRFRFDGISNLKYKLKQVKSHHLFVLISVQ